MFSCCCKINITITKYHYHSFLSLHAVFSSSQFSVSSSFSAKCIISATLLLLFLLSSFIFLHLSFPMHTHTQIDKSPTQRQVKQLRTVCLQATVWLREEAQKEGWEKATKLQNRPMSHGLVGVLTQNQSGVMVEVNVLRGRAS